MPTDPDAPRHRNRFPTGLRAAAWQRALDLCPFLPVESFLRDLFKKAKRGVSSGSLLGLLQRMQMRPSFDHNIISQRNLFIGPIIWTPGPWLDIDIVYSCCEAEVPGLQEEWDADKKANEFSLTARS